MQQYTSTTWVQPKKENRKVKRQLEEKVSWCEGVCLYVCDQRLLIWQSCDFAFKERIKIAHTFSNTRLRIGVEKGEKEFQKKSPYKIWKKILFLIISLAE